MTAPTEVEPAPGGDPIHEPEPGTPRRRGGSGSRGDAPQQLLLAAVLLGIAVAFWFIDSLSESALMIALTGVVISITASAGLFIGANGLASLLPGNASNKVRPWIFVGPALLFIFVTLVVPTVRTLYLSLLDNRGRERVGRGAVRLDLHLRRHLRLRRHRRHVHEPALLRRPHRAGARRLPGRARRAGHRHPDRLLLVGHDAGHRRRRDLRAVRAVTSAGASSGTTCGGSSP